MWEYPYQQDWYGDMTGFKLVMPTTARPEKTWYQSYKEPNCGLNDDCAYNISSIQESAGRIRSLIEHERALVGGDASKVFLVGFSQGAQMTSYMQIANLNYSLGGIIVMDGYPIPPVVDMAGASKEAARKNASYFGDDMRMMIWEGADDYIFPPQQTMDRYHAILAALDVSSTLKNEKIQPGMGHWYCHDEFVEMMQFIHGANSSKNKPVEKFL